MINTVTEAMTAGRFYQFIYKATNLIGDSLLSEVVSIPVADVPSKSSAPILVGHTQTSITVEWEVTPDTQGEAGKITGYYLYMDNGFNEDFKIVFNGAGLPESRQF